MEAVENLVVGKYAYAGLVVYETLVQCAVYGLEVDLVASVGENLAQAVELLGVVRQYQQPVAFALEACKRVGYEVEILMVNPLWRAVEVDYRRPAPPLGRGVAVVGGLCCGKPTRTNDSSFRANTSASTTVSSASASPSSVRSVKADMPVSAIALIRSRV